MLSDVVFILFWLIIVVFAALAVFWQKPIYNAFAMACSIFSIAGIYIFLGYEFIAALQVLIYVGAISVAIIFVIMLSPPVTVQPKKVNVYKVAIGVITSFAFFAVLFAVLYSKFRDAKFVLGEAEGTLKQVGYMLATKMAVPFEIISFILLVAIMGAIVLAKKED